MGVTFLAICLTAGFATLLDQSSLNTAVPSIRASLDASPATVQWIVAGYSLAFGLALVPAGRLGDAYGRKWFFVGGLAVFAAAAVAAGTASEAWMVAVARIVQGLGAGILNPQIIGMIQDNCAGPERARALGRYATAGGISAVIGPLAGAVLLDALGPDQGWRAVLLLNVPLTLLAIPLAIRRLPAAAAIGHPARSPLGTALLPALVRSRGFTLGTLVGMFQFGASLASSFALTLHLQEGRGWSPLHAALIILPSAVGFAVASSLAWRLLARAGRAGVVWALAAGATGLAATVVVVLTVPERWLGLALCGTQLLLGSAAGLVNSPNQALTLAYAPPGTGGLAGGLLQVSQRLAATISMAAAGGVLLGATVPSGTVATAQAVAASGVLMVLAACFAAADLRSPAPAPRPPAVPLIGTPSAPG